MEMRKTGATIRTISLAVKVSERQVRFDLERELQREADRAEKATREYRALQNARIEALIFGLWRAAVAGDPASVSQLVRLFERQARLLGLDGPIKIDIDQRVMEVAIREGIDPNEALATVHRILAEERW